MSTFTRRAHEEDRRIAAERAARVHPVPLECDLLEEIELLKIRLHRSRERARRMEMRRDSWRERALRAERDAELLRAGLDHLKRKMVAA